jgi:alanine transaminase|tara:strand:+ start:171 stop:566 length:396 start_codon:yes stop_codon:yes gene_type:complete
MNVRRINVEPHAEYHKVLTKETLSPNVKECQYAVRGAIPLRGEEIKKMIAAGSTEFEFEKTLPCNIGNPQAVGQGFLTFNREVLSAMMLPKLLDSSQISEDSKERIRLLNSKITSPMGAYTANSKGHMYVR